MLAKLPWSTRHFLNSTVTLLKNSQEQLTAPLSLHARTNTVLGTLCRRGLSWQKKENLCSNNSIRCSGLNKSPRNSSNICGFNKSFVNVWLQRHYNINNSCKSVRGLAASVDTSKELEANPNYVIR
ncbi:10584_t:CDS:1 [Ambispora leptoticha]|uniref:10584_t:CDS:1 n=1 Tax=Ambispora leptoticha TaxID=144679 RepID=A0A9N9FM42_9GLOM|nr:10584_t:CDS:1 [Ambispora leptoticha]